MTARNHLNGSPTLAITVGVITTDLTLTVTSTTGTPSTPFVMALERATVNEEVVLCTAKTATTFTVTRGYDSSTAKNHSIGAALEHTTAALDYQEPNFHINDQSHNQHGQYTRKDMLTTTGDIYYASSASTPARLPIGATSTGLKVVAGVPAWVADSNNTVITTAGDLLYGSSASTQARLAIGSRDGMALLVSSGLPVWGDPIPAGTVRTTIAAAADPGWALINGQTLTNAQTVYPALWAIAPASWKSGANLILPNTANMMLEGAGTTALGATGGSNTASIGTGNLPAHFHDIDHNHPAVNGIGVTLTMSPVVADFVRRLGGALDNSAVTGKSFAGANNLMYNGALTTYADVAAFMYMDYITAFTPTGSGSVNVDIPALGATNSGPGPGAGTALSVVNAHLAVTYQIKVH